MTPAIGGHNHGVEIKRIATEILKDNFEDKFDKYLDDNFEAEFIEQFEAEFENELDKYFGDKFDAEIEQIQLDYIEDATGENVETQFNALRDDLILKGFMEEESTE